MSFKQPQRTCVYQNNISYLANAFFYVCDLHTTKLFISCYIACDIQFYNIAQQLSIYMITRCACVRTYVRTSVAGCPEAWRGIPIDLTRHKERAHCGRAVI